MDKNNDLVASIFTQKRGKPDQYKLRFIKVLEYIVFCYELQLADKKTYSQKECLKTTTYESKFEEYLTEFFVNDYLQENKHLLDLGNRNIRFEVREDLKNPYFHENKSKKQRIDIAFTGITTEIERKNKFDGISSEKIYFAFEAKRVNFMRFETGKPESNISQYIIETDKFLENRKYKHRFPFEGMVGYVESTVEQTIPEMINEIRTKLVDKTTTTQNLQKFDLPNSDFEFCQLSKHIKNDENKTEKEIYHLFLDYSTMVVA